MLSGTRTKRSRAKVKSVKVVSGSVGQWGNYDDGMPYSRPEEIRRQERLL